jgi:ribonuclease J
LTKLTFYAGIHEIGGNKFLVEDRGTRVFLDFGMQMSRFNDYFFEYMKPRTLNGMGDLFEFGLLPSLKGLYRRDYAKHSGFGGNESTEFHAVFLSHAHLDHSAYIHYLRPEIPIYCSEGTKMILQAIEDTSSAGGANDYLTFNENFQIYRNGRGEMSRLKGDERSSPRKLITYENRRKFRVDSIEVEPIEVDHSIPGVSAYIVHTSDASIAYTADIRFHGRRREASEKFVERCSESDIDVLLCEGTRIDEDEDGCEEEGGEGGEGTSSKTEADVESGSRRVISQTENLVVCSYPSRDLDRFLSIYYAVASGTNRELLIDLRQAYLLKLFQSSERYRAIYPSPKDKRIKVYIPRQSWGLIDKDVNYWTEKQILQDYDPWQREFLGYPNRTDYREVSKKQSLFVFSCGDYQLLQLIDINPKEKSAYIRSLTEPFNDEMEIKEERVKRWLSHFGLISSDRDWHKLHVSGHGSGDQIRKIIEGSKAKRLIPVHTIHEERYEKWHSNVLKVNQYDSIEL